MKPRFAAVLALLGALTAAAPAVAKLDPGHTWRTVETPHFAIHFHEGCDDLAARAARIAEEAHALLAPRVGWTPRDRTQIVILDDDASGGWATPYPYNQILVSATPPLGEIGLGTTRHDDWLRLVITHEYTHVLQLDMASGLPRAVNAVFGRLYFPNSLQPKWLTEGLATFEETELTPGGRGRSPGSEMVLRMAVLEGSFPTLDQMAVLPDAWPAGQVPYLFGESFLRYLANRFGREKLAGVSQAYGGRSLPFLVEDTGQLVLSAGYRDLWREWSERLRERFKAQEQALAASGATPAKPLTNDGRLNASPAWSPDGRQIAWLRADGRTFPGVWVMDADGSGSRQLVRDDFPTVASGATLGWSAGSDRLYYTKQGIARGAAVENDIWSYDLVSGRETRVTRGLRARDPDLSPDGRTLVLVTATRGLTRLGLLDLDGGPLPADSPERLRPLTAASAEQYAEPRWSPDGRRIAASVWSPGGGREIRILDREGRVLLRSGSGVAMDGAPAWSPDGRLVHFCSDRTGIFNIFSWDTSTGEIAQTTNVLGGAFSPAPSPDGRQLAFADYTARGFDIRVLDLQPQPSLPRAPAATSAPEAAEQFVPGGATGAWASLAAAPYSPRGTILPRFWVPLVAVSGESGTQLGLATGGQDVLQRHTYALNVLSAPESGRLMHLVEYAYDGMRPTLRLFSADADRTHSGFLRDASGTADYTERVRSVGADVVVGFPGLESSQSLSLGYRYRELSNLTPLPPWDGYGGPLPATGSYGSSHVAWGYSSAHRQALSISPAGGRRVALQLERFQEGFGSELSFTQAGLDWNEYVELTVPGHVLAARLFLGHATGSLPQQGAFTVGGGAPGDIEFTPGDWALRLRGYPEGAFSGEAAVLASLEYRLPLLEVARGGVSAPFFLRRVHSAFFADAGDAGDAGEIGIGSLHVGAGAELRADFTVCYYAPVSVRLGVAAGFDEGGEIRPTLGIRVPLGIVGPGASRGPGSITPGQGTSMSR